ncbi:hypothetical protein KDRO_F06980 [Kluyveromyces lactis]|nr:hypothetical protein KDRO_F06980 [Kluyveromyces lactis]
MDLFTESSLLDFLLEENTVSEVDLVEEVPHCLVHLPTFSNFGPKTTTANTCKVPSAKSKALKKDLQFGELWEDDIARILESSLSIGGKNKTFAKVVPEKASKQEIKSKKRGKSKVKEKSDRKLRSNEPLPNLRAGTAQSSDFLESGIFSSSTISESHYTRNADSLAIDESEHNSASSSTLARNQRNKLRTMQSSTTDEDDKDVKNDVRSTTNQRKKQRKEKREQHRLAKDASGEAKARSEETDEKFPETPDSSGKLSPKGSKNQGSKRMKELIKKELQLNKNKESLKKLQQAINEHPTTEANTSDFIKTPCNKTEREAIELLRGSKQVVLPKASSNSKSKSKSKDKLKNKPKASHKDSDLAVPENSIESGKSSESKEPERKGGSTGGKKRRSKGNRKDIKSEAPVGTQT